MLLLHGKRKGVFKGKGIMRRNKDEFACINRTKNTGKVVLVTIAILAICFTGILYAKKLQFDEIYISIETPVENIVQS